MSIELTHVYKCFNKNYALKDVSLSIATNETMVLLGSSGSGKSTTLQLINKLLTPTKGNIFIDGVDIQKIDTPTLRHNMGYVFQQSGLFPHLSVLANLTVPLKLAHIYKSKAVRQEKARALLTLVNLDANKYAARYPHQLSGGEQQRVSVARALAYDPQYLLMDEPFSALDAITRGALQQEVLRLKKTLNKTIVFVTHDIKEAFLLADKIAVFHQGKIEQVGTAQQLNDNAQSAFVRDLLEPCHD